MQEKVESISPGSKLLPIGFYSDKTLTSSLRSIYPVNLFFPSAPSDVMFQEKAYRCIGHIPEPPTHSNVLKKGKMRDRLRKWMMYRSLDIILKPFKELSHTGLKLASSDGEINHYYPIPVMYIADIQEYQAIFGISASVQISDSLPDPSYLVSTKDLSKSRAKGGMPPRRNEKDTVKIIERSQHLVSIGRVEKALSKLKKISLDPLLLYSPSQDLGTTVNGKAHVEYFLVR